MAPKHQNFGQISDNFARNLIANISRIKQDIVERRTENGVAKGNLSSACALNFGELWSTNGYK